MNRFANAKISIVIPSWNGAKILAPALHALRSLEDPNFEILVIDHGKVNEETEQLCKEMNHQLPLKYVGRIEQLGFTGAVNLGSELAGGSIVAVICNDVIVDSHWLKPVRERFHRLKDQESPVLFSNVKRNPQLDNELGETNLWMRAIYPREKESLYFFHPDGSSFFFEKKIYSPPFDAEYFLYQEDVYLGFKAWIRGQAVELVPDSKALNEDGGTTRRTPYLTSFYSERNRWLNYFTFFQSKTILLILPALFVDYFLKLLFGKNRKAKISALLWILMNRKHWIKKRREMQSLRQVDDEKILENISFRYSDEKQLLNEIFQFLLLPLSITRKHGLKKTNS